jgi:hypothetical protein
MCNQYSALTKQGAIADLSGAERDRVGNPVRRGIMAEAAAKLLVVVKVSTIQAANLTFNTRSEVQSWLQTASAKDLPALSRSTRPPRAGRLFRRQPGLPRGPLSGHLLDRGRR